MNPADFTTRIDNPYFPLVPGDRYVYRETDGKAKEKVVLGVSHKTKLIANGITARIVHDRVTERGKVVEDTFDWYAQDSDGNVWYLGEDTVECKKGKIKNHSGSFEAGVDGAQPGVIMPANPEPGMKYRQEYYAGEAEDAAYDGHGICYIEFGGEEIGIVEVDFFGDRVTGSLQGPSPLSPRPR